MAVKRKLFAQRRRAMGFTQESLAERMRVDRTTVVRWERGDCQPQPWLRRGLAAALEVSLDGLERLLRVPVAVPALDEAPVPVDTLESRNNDGGDTTNRRNFASLAAFVSLGSVGPLGKVLASTDVPGAICMEHVQVAASLVDRFRQADAAIGANALCDLAIGVHERLSQWARRSSYSREVGEALQVTLADLANQVAWLAVDADRRAQSRTYLNEAISRARIADEPREEVRALACLSLLTRSSQPKESLQCAEAARRVAAGWATPRLQALLHLRAAHAHAYLKDGAAYERAAARALNCMEKGQHEDDLPFLRFVTPQEATGLAGLAQLALGRSRRAVAAFQSIADTAQPATRRNEIYYRVRLAQAAQRAGDLNQAAAVALDVLPQVAAIQSRRTTGVLARLRADLGQSGSAPEVAAFVAAYDQARP